MSNFQWPIVVSILVLVASTVAATHALLNKKDPRAALGWIVLCFALPVFGPFIYVFLGVNRSTKVAPRSAMADSRLSSTAAAVAIADPLDRVAARVSHYPCSKNNRLEILTNGEQAYPAMIAAIENARQSVILCTYIFDSDDAGQAFIDALGNCVDRGVTVRVLIDSIGSLYSFPSTVRRLRKAGVPTRRFLPLFHRDGWKLNMRNHRKILSIDGRTAFAGGMNIGNRHMVSQQGSNAAEDMQVLIEGSAVRSITDMFCRDWKFATGEPLDIECPEKHTAGHTACRPVSDGPGSELGTLPKLLLGLLSTATKCITIVTPYFLPPPAIAGALIGATLRGVEVRILIPERNNLAYVKWATQHALLPLLRASIDVYSQPGPFAHTKMLLIDDNFLQIGSYNMDDRSLRLNFELALNIYDADIRRDIDRDLRDRLTRSKRYEPGDIQNRPLLVRIRNAIAWLFAPYL